MTISGFASSKYHSLFLSYNPKSICYHFFFLLCQNHFASPSRVSPGDCSRNQYCPVIVYPFETGVFGNEEKLAQQSLDLFRYSYRNLDSGIDLLKFYHKISCHLWSNFCSCLHIGKERSWSVFLELIWFLNYCDRTE